MNHQYTMKEPTIESKKKDLIRTKKQSPAYHEKNQHTKNKLKTYKEAIPTCNLPSKSEPLHQNIDLATFYSSS